MRGELPIAGTHAAAFTIPIYHNGELHLKYAKQVFFFPRENLWFYSIFMPLINFLQLHFLQREN